MTETLQERQAPGGPASPPRPWPSDRPAEAVLWADFLENAAEGLHQADGEGRILWANRAEAAMLGYTREEYIGLRLADLHADPAVLEGILATLRAGGPVRGQPARLRARNGTLRNVVIEATARVEEGRLVHTRCLTRDVTDQVRLDEARQAAAKLLDTMADGFLHVGRDWRITYANPMARGTRRETKERMEGRVLWEVHPQVLGTPFEGRYRDAMAGQPSTFEAYYPGTGSWYENRLLPVEDGFWLYYRDVTARHQMEALLRARNHQQAAVARLGQVALSTRQLNAVLDAAVREAAQALNVEFCKILKLRPEGDLLLRAGVGWRSGLVGTHTVPAGLESQAGYTLQSGGAVVVTDLAGETRFHVTPLLAEHGVASGMGVTIQGPERPYGVISVHTAQRRDFNEDDIHFLQAIAHLLAAAIERSHADRELRRHRDHLEELVRERTRLLEESNRELEAFSYSVSHDLRAPLRTMGGFSDLLLHRHGPRLDPEVRELLGLVHDGALRMGRLIEDLLDLSRFHRVAMQPEEVDLAPLAEEVVAGLRRQNPGRDVEVRVEPGLQARGDPQLLRIVLDNLLGNAWKFTGATPRPRIEVGRGATPDGPAFFVRDNGAGFDPAFASQLFRPFHRLHKPHEFEGNGIGLATVARIVQRHGGRVWAEGVPGEGATFHFTLP
ncbi:MAG: PAS domain-containing protein [Thermoplasmatota archaeon]